MHQPEGSRKEAAGERILCWHSFAPSDLGQYLRWLHPAGSQRAKEYAEGALYGSASQVTVQSGMEISNTQREDVTSEPCSWKRALVAVCRKKKTNWEGHGVWETSTFLVQQKLSISALGQWQVQVGRLKVPQPFKWEWQCLGRWVGCRSVTNSPEKQHFTETCLSGFETAMGERQALSTAWVWIGGRQGE